MINAGPFKRLSSEEAIVLKEFVKMLELSGFQFINSAPFLHDKKILAGLCAELSSLLIVLQHNPILGPLIILKSYDCNNHQAESVVKRAPLTNISAKAMIKEFFSIKAGSDLNISNSELDCFAKILEDSSMLLCRYRDIISLYLKPAFMFKSKMYLSDTELVLR